MHCIVLANVFLLFARSKKCLLTISLIYEYFYSTLLTVLKPGLCILYVPRFFLLQHLNTSMTTKYSDYCTLLQLKVPKTCEIQFPIYYSLLIIIPSLILQVIKNLYSLFIFLYSLYIYWIDKIVRNKRISYYQCFIVLNDLNYCILIYINFIKCFLFYGKSGFCYVFNVQ